MLYCEKCRLLCTDNDCHDCGAKKLREPKDNDPVYLMTKDSLFSDGIEYILKENSIPCIKQGLNGSGITTQLGYITETYRFFVPFGAYNKSKELLDNFFDD